MIGKIALIRIRILWRQISEVRRAQFFFLLILMIFTSFAEVLSISAVIPFLAVLTAPESLFNNIWIKPLLDFLDIRNAGELILPLTIFFILAASLSGIMRIILLWSQTRWSHGIGADLSFKVYKLSLHQPYIKHLNRNSSELIAAITTKINNVAYQVIHPLITLLSSLFILVSVVAILVAINPAVALLTFSGFGLIYVLIILGSTSRLKVYSDRISKEQIKVVKSLQEGLGGIRDVLIDNSQELYSNIFKSSDKPLRRAIANVHILSGIPRFGIEALGMIFIAILAYLMTHEDTTNSYQIVPMLGALAIGAQRLLPILQLGYQSWITFIGHLEPLGDVLDLLEQPMPNIHLSQEDIKEPKISFESLITLENVCFSYDDQKNIVLNNINLDIKKGSMIGIIGSTGSGKTTLTDIIMGLLSPSRGNILIDGKPITEKNISSWQARIAHVPQHIYLSDATIKENIAFGVENNLIDFNKVKECAELAELSDFVNNLDSKFDTIVGERGARLSGGQRQRIGIARALYKNADVIIFDEATSALDDKTEKLIMASINNLSLNITCLIIAHRLKTLENCDTVIKIENGEIVSSGSYKQVVNTPY